MYSEVMKIPMMPYYAFEWQLEMTHKINEPASALAVTSEGNIISSTSNSHDNESRDSGSIILRDSEGKYLKTLVEEPATALAIMPLGDIISSTSYQSITRRAKMGLYGYQEFYTEIGRNIGNIVLRNSEGQYLETLCNKPASALLATPTSNIISGSSYNRDEYLTSGAIVLRDSKGQYLKTIANNTPSTALMYSPDGSTIISNFPFSCWRNMEQLVNYNDSDCFKRIKMVIEPGTALAMTPDGRLITGSNFQNSGDIIFHRIKLTKVAVASTNFLEILKQLLIDNIALSCLQFQKGHYESDCNLALLYPQILHKIYCYAFPFPYQETEIILNYFTSSFPFFNKNEVESVPTAVLFADKVSSFTFFNNPLKQETTLKKEKDPSCKMM